jgi:hypothetical protein
MRIAHCGWVVLLAPVLAGVPAAQAPLAANRPPMVDAVDELPWLHAAARGDSTVPDTTAPWTYFPLGQGDIWEYEFPSGKTLRQHILGDTTINGRASVWLYHQDFSATGVPSPHIFRFPVRYDSTEARVVVWDVDELYLIPCRLDTPFNAAATCVGASSGWVSGGYDGALVFDNGTQIDTIWTAVKQITHMTEEIRYAADFGIAYYFCGECSDSPTWLRGARIGGVMYGQLLYPVVGAEPGSEAPRQSTLRIWPNPTSNNAIASVRLDVARSVDLTVHDLLGRRVLERRIGLAGPGHEGFELDLTSLPPATYVVRLTIDGRTLAQRRVTRMP